MVSGGEEEAANHLRREGTIRAWSETLPKEKLGFPLASRCIPSSKRFCLWPPSPHTHTGEIVNLT